MTIDDLIQLMRTCSLANVRRELEIVKKEDWILYDRLVQLYVRAARK